MNYKQCCNDLTDLIIEHKKLQRNFQTLLISNSNTIYKMSKQQQQNKNRVAIEQELRQNGFPPHLIKRVSYKMYKSSRPSSNYSKHTGLLKKTVDN